MDIKEIDVWFDSDKGKEAVERCALKWKKEDEYKGRWVERFNTYFETLNDSDFEILIETLTIWEEKYDDMWYDRGILTYSNLLGTLLNVSETYGTTLESEEMFEAARHEYRGFVFSVYHGQGTIIGITYKGKRIF